MGIDLGTRRVGVAVSDGDGRVATVHTIVTRSGDDAADRAALVEVIGALGAGLVVVGLPLSLDASLGPAARWATAEADALRSLLDVPVELHDERFSTVAALRTPRSRVSKHGRRRGRGPRRSEEGGDGAPPGSGEAASRHRRVDGRAAAVMLQSWLDRSNAQSKERTE
ncbi:MAG: Holliday junction resolvase RuvX [Acidimicrobiales bacterium]